MASMGSIPLDAASVEDGFMDGGSIGTLEDSDKGTMDAEDNKPIMSTTIVIMIKNQQTDKHELFKVLLDSGTSKGMMTLEAARRAGLHVRTAKPITYNTAAGRFTTELTARIRAHRILGLNSRRELGKRRVAVTKGTLGPYDLVLGRGYLQDHGIDLVFSESLIKWDGMSLAMRPPDFYSADRIQNMLPHTFIESRDHFVTQIMDSKYDKQDLPAVVRGLSHLTADQQSKLLAVLQRFEDLFAGRLGLWPDGQISIDLDPEIEPFHCHRAMRIPHIHLETLKKEVRRLVEIGVLEVVDGATAGPWCAPSFIIPKKDGRVRFLTDYRRLNRAIRRKPWPMPHILDMIQDIGAFTYVTALDLSMGYYHFELDEQAKQLSTFMLPWGIYRYRRLPMGLNISPDLFQEHMSKLFADMQHVLVYIDDLLVFTNGSYEDHLEKVAQALERLQSKNLAVNALKSYWAVTEVDYLGFRLTREGVKPQERKIKAIMNIKPPTNKRALRGFIGLVNWYRHMWKRRSHLLAPMAAMAGANTPFNWTDECQRSFTELKRIISKEVLLTFPDYTKPFQLYTDASDLQLGAVLMQGDKTLAFFSKKLNQTQMRYSTGEKEMLSVVEALKEFRTMVLGYPIDVFVDHKNWTHDKAIKNSRVQMWRLTLEEYIITLHYIKGEDNVVADAMSRQLMEHLEQPLGQDDSFLVEEAFDMHEATWRKFYQPITLAEIGREQLKDQQLQQLKEQAPDSIGEVFEDIGRKSGPDAVATLMDQVDGTQRIFVPATSRLRLMQWYHAILVHPGGDRLFNTLKQHYTWPNMRDEIRTLVKHCEACQLAKRGFPGMGHVPLKDVETEPWKDVAVDLAGPWTAHIDGKDVLFHTFTIVDVFSGWVEIIPISTKKMETIAELFVREWIRRYPRPSRVIFDAGGEFDNEIFTAMLNLWFINRAPVTVKNPRANAIVERMHRVLGDMLRAQLVRLHPKEDVVYELTSAAAYGIRATVHGTTRFTPAQIVYNRDLILRTKFEADIELIRLQLKSTIVGRTSGGLHTITNRVIES